MFSFHTEPLLSAMKVMGGAYLTPPTEWPPMRGNHSAYSCNPINVHRHMELVANIKYLASTSYTYSQDAPVWSRVQETLPQTVGVREEPCLGSRHWTVSGRNEPRVLLWTHQERASTPLHRYSVEILSCLTWQLAKMKIMCLESTYVMWYDRLRFCTSIHAGN